MQAHRRLSLLGIYAIHLGTLTEAVKLHRRFKYVGSNGQSENLSYTVQPNIQPIDRLDNVSSSDDGEAKLIVAVEKAHTILIKADAVFPFDIFPDTITLDRQKLTIVHRSFFSVKQTTSVQYSDIKNIQAGLGPFLGSVTVTSEHFINNIQTIKFLPKKSALAIQQLVQGFIVAHNENIDMSDIDDKKLVELLNQLGRGEAGEKALTPK